MRKMPKIPTVPPMPPVEPPKPMTKGDILTMGPGPLLDLFFQEKVKGIKVETWPDDMGFPPAPRVSTDVSVALREANKMMAKGYTYNVHVRGDSRKYVSFDLSRHDERRVAWGDTLPEAITKAILLTTLNRFEELHAKARKFDEMVSEQETALGQLRESRAEVYQELRQVCPHPPEAIERTPDPSGQAEGVCVICKADLGKVK